MKAMLVEHKVQIPEEWQPKVKAILVLLNQVNTEAPKTTLSGQHIQSVALHKLKGDVYREIATELGMLYFDYPVWDVSDSGEELIGYRYEFQEEE